MEQFVGFMRGIGEKISNWWSANKSWAAPAIGVGLAGLAIGAIAVSGGGALAAAPALAAIPALANGGVLTSPQVVLVGEYPGARRNPEIVTPQSLMYDTFRDAQDTDVVVNAIMAGVNQIVRAIQDSNVEVYVDGDGTATQNRRNRMYGKTLNISKAKGRGRVAPSFFYGPLSFGCAGISLDVGISQTNRKPH